ncbi:uncharacterized protein EHS24_008262 [Apiotrichum porosum]|uniref:Uncharacterized protein n=1 Tax=Apiotrichum porosum TaxID=105984 RepID=A0A427XTC7_9TREE|nr:uncharacterized protein EHS24_008262 [Apiotrichum porosum]RSH82058.1 hypothetical protein EHS24_008262 [Apiotrichum porosum]
MPALAEFHPPAPPGYHYHHHHTGPARSRSTASLNSAYAAHSHSTTTSSSSSHSAHTSARIAHSQSHPHLRSNYAAHNTQRHQHASVSVDHLHPSSAHYSYHPAHPSHLSTSFVAGSHGVDGDDMDMDLDVSAMTLADMGGPPPHLLPATPFPHSFPSAPPPKTSSGRLSLTSLARSLVYRYVVPYLPYDLQAIAENPPDLSRPETLVPVLRALAPYTQFLLVLVALYVVWAIVAGFVGYIARFMRFCFRIGPVIALIAWVMAATGQGGIDVLFEALRQYAGMEAGAGAPAQQRGGPPPGRGPAGYNYNYASSDASRSSSSRNSRRPRSGSSSGSDSSFWDAPPRNNKRPGSQSRAGGYHGAGAANANGVPPPPDILSAIFGGAAGDGGLGAQVQGFVRQAVARGVGLEWLLGGASQQPEESKEEARRRS